MTEDNVPGFEYAVSPHPCGFLPGRKVGFSKNISMKGKNIDMYL